MGWLRTRLHSAGYAHKHRMMYYPLACCIGLRYIRSRKADRFVSFVSWLSLLGMALGVAALVVVLSVMNGYHEAIADRILRTTPHITLQSAGGRLAHWEPLWRQMQSQAHVQRAVPFVSGQAMITAPGGVQFALLRGMLPGQGPVASQPGSFDVVLGGALAERLGVTTGDRIMLVIPEAALTVSGLIPRAKQCTVIGVSHEAAYQDYRVLFHLQDLQALYRLGDTISGIELQIDEVHRASELRAVLQHQLPSTLIITDWSQEHQALFAAIRLEKRLMCIMLSLIVMVAAFNVLSSLVMLVSDKKAEIAVLRTMGASAGLVMAIFMVQGTALGILGATLGAGVGWWIAAHITAWARVVEAWWDIAWVTSNVYGIDFLPSSVHGSDVAWVVGVAWLVSFIATWYPAWRAAQVYPAEALRTDG